MPTVVLTLQEVMSRLKVSRATVYRLMDQGELHPFKIGGSLRFDEEDLEAYIERCKAAGRAEDLPPAP